MAVFVPVPLRDPTDLSHSSESCRSEELFGPVLCSFWVVSALYPLWGRKLLLFPLMSKGTFEYRYSYQKTSVYHVRDIWFRE